MYIAKSLKDYKKKVNNSKYFIDKNLITPNCYQKFKKRDQIYMICPAAIAEIFLNFKFFLLCNNLKTIFCFEFLK